MQSIMIILYINDDNNIVYIIFSPPGIDSAVAATTTGNISIVFVHVRVSLVSSDRIVNLNVFKNLNKNFYL